ncbi:hypothetical protein [Ornithobacterium rhinotracheale]|uniref:hypothetical protein n=1 Tax=Ornithobacterium rhinotracheale TaxID=28251 RepID=UPI0040356BD0
MKKLFLLFALFMAFIPLGSCSSDDDDSNLSKNDIVGVWYMVEYKDNGSWKSMRSLNQYMNFNNDNTYTTNYLGVYDYGKYSVRGKVVETRSEKYGTTRIEIIKFHRDNTQVKLYNLSDPSDVDEIVLEKEILRKRGRLEFN